MSEGATSQIMQDSYVPSLSSTCLVLDRVTLAILLTGRVNTVYYLAFTVNSREQANQSTIGLVDFNQSTPTKPKFYHRISY